VLIYGKTANRDFTQNSCLGNAVLPHLPALVCRAVRQALFGQSLRGVPDVNMSLFYEI
jgi:hypothetical protein